MGPCTVVFWLLLGSVLTVGAVAASPLRLSTVLAGRAQPRMQWTAQAVDAAARPVDRQRDSAAGRVLRCTGGTDDSGAGGDGEGAGAAEALDGAAGPGGGPAEAEEEPPQAAAAEDQAGPAAKSTRGGARGRSASRGRGATQRGASGTRGRGRSRGSSRGVQDTSDRPAESPVTDGARDDPPPAPTAHPDDDGLDEVPPPPPAGGDEDGGGEDPCPPPPPRRPDDAGYGSAYDNDYRASARGWDARGDRTESRRYTDLSPPAARGHEGAGGGARQDGDDARAALDDGYAYRDDDDGYSLERGGDSGGRYDRIGRAAPYADEGRGYRGGEPGSNYGGGDSAGGYPRDADRGPRDSSLHDGSRYSFNDGVRGPRDSFKDSYYEAERGAGGAGRPRDYYPEDRGEGGYDRYGPDPGAGPGGRWGGGGRGYPDNEYAYRDRERERERERGGFRERGYPDDDYRDEYRSDREYRDRGGWAGGGGGGGWGWRGGDYPPDAGYYNRGMPPPPRRWGGMDDYDRGGERPPSLPRGDPRFPDPQLGEKVSLLVRNFSKFTSRAAIRRIFGSFGEVRDVYIPRDYHTKRPKNYAFIEYQRYEAAKEALRRMDGETVDGRTLSVCFAQMSRKNPDQMATRPRLSPPPHREGRDSGRKRGFRSDYDDPRGGEAGPRPFPRDRFGFDQGRQRAGGGGGGSGSGRAGRCYNCNEMGHISRECPEPPTDETLKRRGASKGGAGAAYDERVPERGEGVGGAEGQERAEETGLEPESGDGVRKIQRTKDGDDERQMPSARDAGEDNGGDWRRDDDDTGGEGNQWGGLTAEEQLEKEYQAAVDQGQVPSMDPPAGDGAEVAGAEAGGAEEGGAAKSAADAGGEEQGGDVEG